MLTEINLQELLEKLANLPRFDQALLSSLLAEVPNEDMPADRIYQLLVVGQYMEAIEKAQGDLRYGRDLLSRIVQVRPSPLPGYVVGL